MKEKLLSVRDFVGNDFPEHLCRHYIDKKITDKNYLTKILTDRKPFVIVFYKYFKNPIIIRHGTKPKFADEQFEDFNKKYGNPIIFEEDARGIEAIYDCLEIKFCPFCGEKLYYTSRRKWENKIKPKIKNPDLVITHKIIDFDSIKNNHSKMCSLCYRINSKKHNNNDEDFKLWLEGLPKYPDYDCYKIIHYILTMCNPYYIYIPRTWNVCINKEDKSYFFKDMIPSIWYQSDRRHIKFGKPKGVN